MGHVARAVLVAIVVSLGCRNARATPRPQPAPVPRPPVVVTSPGPLAASHGAATCDACHVNNSKDTDANKCLACHAELRARIQAGKGFHASTVVKGRSCAVCHLDHRGRAFDLMGWRSIRGGKNGFDHDLTGWPLDGAHRGRPCSDCHTKTNAQGVTTYLGTDRLCGSCHPTHPHGFAQGPLLACDRCHGTHGWRPALANLRFDHDDRKDARMPLLGAHASVACRACHPAGKFALALAQPERCDNCHQSPHAGHLFGTRDCTWCHGPRTPFATAVFDHAERTSFDLGGHKALACARCHAKSFGTKKPSAACETCHANRAPHGTRFKAFGSPPACALCHTTRFFAMPAPKWRPTGFDHAKHTKFPLFGKHTELSCRACHRGSGPTQFERLSSGDACMSCHEHATVHDGKFKNTECLSCHFH